MRADCRWIVGAAVAALVLMPVGVGAQPNSDLRNPPGPQWLTVGGDWTNSRYSTLDRLTPSNVGGLKGAWMTRLNGSGMGARYSQQATPLVKDGVMFVPTGQHDVFALDAKTGAMIWQFYSEDVDPRSEGTWANRGLALGDGMLFLGRIDGTFIALDQKTGTMAWKSQVGETPPYVDPEQPGWRPHTQYINSAPLYYDGIVYTGLSGGDRALRGRLTALDARTGHELWRFYTVPAPGELGGDTWPANSDAYKRGGGGVWMTPAIDADLGLLFFNTGNAFPDFDGSVREGDNLFTASVMAIDAKSGQYRWHRQLVHHDIWDFDAPNPVVLFDAVVNGQTRKAVAEIASHGWIFAFDRRNGEPIYGFEERPVPQDARQKTAATQPYPTMGESIVPQCITDPTPGYVGGCYYDTFWDIPNRETPGSGPRWAPMSYNPLTQYFYVTAAINPTAFQRVDDFLGGLISPIGSKQGGLITAVDSRTNTVVWQKKLPYRNANGSGTMATAGGLVFHGEPDGNFLALDARTGEELWRFQTGFGAEGGPITYEVNGEQYVAIATGGTSLNGSAKGDAVWSFKLGGKLLPLYAPPPPPNVITFTGEVVQTNAVKIDGFQFQPQRVTVPVGSTVTWTNLDSEPHTASDQGQIWDTDLVAGGQSASVTFDRAGTYSYFCKPHPWMVAQLIVK